MHTRLQPVRLALCAALFTLQGGEFADEAKTRLAASAFLRQAAAKALAAARGTPGR